MQFISSSRTVLFCANKDQLYNMNTVAKSSKATSGRSKLCEERDKQSTPLLHCRRRPAYLTSSMSVLRLVILSMFLSFFQCSMNTGPKAQGFMPDTILARPNEGTSGEGVQLPCLSHLSFASVSLLKFSSCHVHLSFLGCTLHLLCCPQLKNILFSAASNRPNLS